MKCLFDPAHKEYNSMINFSIPVESLPLIASGRKQHDAYNDLISAKKADVIDLLTFGLVNTPIKNNATGEIAGYVIVWLNNDVTTVDADGRLLGVNRGFGYTTPAQAVAIFEKHFMSEVTDGNV